MFSLFHEIVFEKKKKKRRATTMTMTKKMTAGQKNYGKSNYASLSRFLYVTNRQTNRQTEKSEKTSSQNMKRHLRTLQGYER